jgi:hypothetical protein
MKPFNVPMRGLPVPPSQQAPSLRTADATTSPATRERDSAAVPTRTEVEKGSRAPAPPVGVSAFAWEMLLGSILEAQRHSAAPVAPLRETVLAVVRELRAANQTWEQVYAVLHAAVAPAPERLERWVMGYEVHSSRSAALVAHMQSWADGERLAEIEADAHTD